MGFNSGFKGLILIGFPWQQWSCEGASVLYRQCLSCVLWNYAAGFSQ